jgi:hypothetical protein
MEKFDSKRTAAQRGPPKLFERSSPKVFPWAFEGAVGARHGIYLRQYRELSNLRGQTNETLDIIDDWRFDSLWNWFDRLVGDGH